MKLFGEHYRSVKENPEGDDHQNIRNFMKYGWEGTSVWFINIRLRSSSYYYYYYSFRRPPPSSHLWFACLLVPPGIPFENGIALTRKNVGENEWDWDAESWIP